MRIVTLLRNGHVCKGTMKFETLTVLLGQEAVKPSPVWAAGSRGSSETEPP